jgi:hypothetical protein
LSSSLPIKVFAARRRANRDSRVLVGEESPGSAGRDSRRAAFWRVACLPAFLPDQGIAPSMKDGEDNDLSSFDAVEH